MKRQCSNCQWWYTTGDSIDECPIGNCKVLPPQRVNHAGVAVFPVTYNYDFCSHFQTKDDQDSTQPEATEEFHDANDCTHGQSMENTAVEKWAKLCFGVTPPNDNSLHLAAIAAYTKWVDGDLTTSGEYAFRHGFLAGCEHTRKQNQ